ncbi:stage II sporulation protein P [Ureibacillus massiliensis 4400831 = CIP 108448 = CCUG 49529]|uniref:Stage II sporulation protein P n=1 Tax=Ureibacillus massiliensis 4400831 = CIP 108448 = CCUG 49529 TaxID=1211035 RepID=A0A0A3J190_9BACL|nr:stage II sporulation protein P [Ureibacillus massiliensis]KGR90711.1 stage II sporulation protein P [Ureibacillus massiliensis 4400831 = CIP 108448 = CCUG 49529]
MIKQIQILSAFLIFFFVLPIIAGILPFPNNEKIEYPKAEQQPVVYAASNETETATATDVSQPLNPFDVLLYFTHSHETYKPFVQSASGTVAVYDEHTNLFTMQDMIENYFRLNGLTPKTLDVDVMSVMKRNGLAFYQAYDAVRPYVEKELQQNEYDLILDIHRDSQKKDVSTITHNNVSYAKIAFVIGAENPNYKENVGYAKALSDSLNKIIPNISRGVIEKKGAGVDGVYNQDLAGELLVVEIGGIDNTEDEVYRTVSILAQAISKTFVTEEL